MTPIRNDSKPVVSPAAAAPVAAAAPAAPAAQPSSEFEAAAGTGRPADLGSSPSVAGQHVASSFPLGAPRTASRPLKLDSPEAQRAVTNARQFIGDKFS